MLECLNLNNSARACNSTETILFTYCHVKLPLRWFLLCGTSAYSYVPANSTGTQCTLGRLTVFMPSFTRQQNRDLKLLTSDCDSHTVLFSKTEYVALATSLVGVPALVAGNSRNINSLACTLVKSLLTFPVCSQFCV